jgi:hypothetical protein
MKGIDYIFDEKGKRKAAVVDLRKWGEEFEDFCDGLAGELRKDEPLVPWEVLKAEIAAEKAGG